METMSALLALCAGNSPLPGEFPHKGQWCEALMFSLICAWINTSVNHREAGDLRRHRAHYNVTVMHTLMNVLEMVASKIVTLTARGVSYVITVIQETPRDKWHGVQCQVITDRCNFDAKLCNINLAKLTEMQFGTWVAVRCMAGSIC